MDCCGYVRFVRYLGGFMSCVCYFLPTHQASYRLIKNIDIFHRRKCADARDRIFSLISISRDGADLRVDYQCSPLELIQRVMYLDGNRFCTRRAAFMFRPLWMDRLLSYQEKRMAFIIIERSETQKHATQCSGCGNFRQVAHAMAERYICLCCLHTDGKM
jgi:hypothetical protein